MSKKEKELKFFEDLKIDDEGTIKAVIATLDVVDKHNDIMLPGSIGEQKVVIGAYNHSSWFGNFMPVGKGRTFERDGKAHLEGKLALETTAGKDMREFLKFMGRDQEWSFSLQGTKGKVDDKGIRRISKTKVREVSPVIEGASIGTRTSQVKSDDEPEENNLGLELAKGIGRRHGL